MANRRNQTGGRSYPYNSMTTTHPWQTPMVGANPGLQHFISQLNDNQVSGLAVALSNMYRGVPPSLIMPSRYGGLTSFRQQYGRINRPHIEGRKFGATKIRNKPQQNEKPQKKKKNKTKKTETKTEETDVAENASQKSGEEAAAAPVKEGTSPVPAAPKKNKDGRYVGIPTQFLKCVVCDKTMWDGESFEKHLKGRAHKLMFEALEESHKIQADMMRQTIRLAEERKAIELNRMRRLGKRVDFRKGTDCTMCDYNFYGQETAHRKSDGHQKLKQFLHPRCKRCRLEFTTRIDWEEHKLTPEHLLRRVNARENNGGKGLEIKTEPENLDSDPQTEPEQEVDILEIRKNYILDLSPEIDFPSIKDLKIRIPPYRKSRAVGSSFLTETTGKICSLCTQFFPTPELCDIHCKSRNHYDKYILALKQAAQDAKKDNSEEAGSAEDESSAVVSNGGGESATPGDPYFEANEDVIIEKVVEDGGEGPPKDFWDLIDKDIDNILSEKRAVAKEDGEVTTPRTQRAQRNKTKPVGKARNRT